jgi:hypothetical protein
MSKPRFGLGYKIQYITCNTRSSPHPLDFVAIVAIETDKYNEKKSSDIVRCCNNPEFLTG